MAWRITDHAPIRRRRVTDARSLEMLITPDLTHPPGVRIFDSQDSCFPPTFQHDTGCGHCNSNVTLPTMTIRWRTCSLASTPVPAADFPTTFPMKELRRERVVNYETVARFETGHSRSVGSDQRSSTRSLANAQFSSAAPCVARRLRCQPFQGTGSQCRRRLC